MFSHLQSQKLPAEQNPVNSQGVIKPQQPFMNAMLSLTTKCHQISSISKSLGQVYVWGGQVQNEVPLALGQLNYFWISIPL